MGIGYQRGLVRKVLVVAPSSVCPVWPKEMESYSDFPNTCLYPIGTSTRRGELIRDFAEKKTDALKMVVINYEATWRIEEMLEYFDPDMIICDESQRIKNPTGRQSKCMHRLGLKAKYRMILTGTPVQNNPLDFWSQYRFLNPAIFGTSFYAFRAKYAVMGGMRVNGRPVQVVSYRNLDDLTERAYRCAMRVRKADCLDLPPKTYETRYVELSPEERRVYKQMQRDNIAFIGERECTAQIVLTRLLILQRITGGFMRMDDDKYSTQIGRSKLNALQEIVEDVIASGEKLVVFVRFTDEYNAVCKMLDTNGIGYAGINGAVPLKARGQVVWKFQNDKDCKVFVGQIEAAGTGITLTASGICVFYSPTWNYATYMQAQDRTHRIGAKRECHYINLIAQDTVDEDVMRALSNKKNLADLVVDGTVSAGGATIGRGITGGY